MTQRTLSSLTFLVLLATSVAGVQETTSNWPSFRGPRASGIAEGSELPVEWNVPAGKGVLWRTPIPGLGHSCPVIWDDHLYVTTAVRKESQAELTSLYGSPGYGAGDSVENEGAHAFKLYCLDKGSGEILWERTAYEGPPKVKRHPKSTHANPTPTCDDGRVVAFFGSEGLYAYNHAGEPLWERDFGVLDAGAPDMPKEKASQYQWGFASSPVLENGRLLVQCDVQDQSFVACLDAETGKELWRTLRDENPTWCTPTVADTPSGDAQVVLNGYKHIGGYDLRTGEERWKLVGGGDVPVPTPVVAGDLIYFTSAHGRLRPLYAVRAGASGELTTEAGEDKPLAWYHPRKGVYMQTLLVYGAELYVCSDGGVLGCYDAMTGEEIYRERLGEGASGFSASAVAGDGKLYFTGESGQVHVVRAGMDFEVLATNELGETSLATPAISQGRIFFRTRGHVVAVGAPGKED